MFPLFLLFESISFDAKYTSINRMLHTQWAGQVGATRGKNLPALNLDTTPVCLDESRVGVDSKQYNSWSEHYFDIEIDWLFL